MNQGLFKDFMVYSNSILKKHDLQVAEVVFFRFTALTQFANLQSFVDTLLKMNEGFIQVRNHYFAKANAIASSEAKTKSCCYFMDLCFNDYIELIVVMIQSYLSGLLLIQEGIVHLHLGLENNHPCLLLLSFGLSVQL